MEKSMRTHALRSASLAPAIAALLALSLLIPPAAAQGPPPSEVRLPLAAYEALVKAARDHSGPQASWGTGRITVDLPPEPAQFVAVTLEASFEVLGSGLAEVLLLPGNAILEDARIDGQAATLIMRGGHTALVEAGSRRRNVSLRYRVAVQPSTDGAAVAMIPTPPLPGSTMTIRGRQANTPVEVWPSGQVREVGGNLEASLPATHAAVLRWGMAGDLVRRVDYRVRVDPGADGADIEARYEVVVEGRRAMVRLAPATVALTDVREGNTAITTRVAGGWHQAILDGGGRRTLVATFRVGIDRSQGQPVVDLTVPPSPITRVEAIIPGKRAVTLSPAVPVTHAVRGEDDQAITTATAFLPPTERVSITWTEPRTAPERVVSINTETYQLIRIDEGVVRSRVEVRYEVIRGTLKEIPIELPDDPGVVLYRVSGEGIEDWRTFAATDSAPRQARIFLGSEREGSYRLTLELEKIIPTEFGADIDLPLVRPLDVTRERGAVALFDGEKVSFAPAVTDNARAGEDALPVEIRQGLAGDIVAQAFQHISGPRPIRSKVQEATEREFSFDARVESLALFHPNSLELHAIIAVDVKAGRTNEVLLSLPRGVTIAGEVNAPSLRSAEWAEDVDATAPRRNYRVQLTQALGGHFTIELALSRTVSSDLSELTLPDVQVLGATVQKGTFGVATETMMEVSPKSSQGLIRVDVSQLPRSITLQTKREIELAYAYSFTRDDAAPRLDLNLRRHQAVETLTAAITSARLETIVFEEGGIVTRATFEVDNRDQNFLPLTLPADARVLGATVDGQSAEPIADDDSSLKIRIPRQRRSQVALVYLVRRADLGFLSSVDLVAPLPGVFVKDLSWLVRVPKKYTIYSTSSDLREADLDAWLPATAAAGTALDIHVTTTEPVQELHFRLDVFDAPEATAPLRVSLSLVAAPGLWLDLLVLILVAVILGWIVWRRAARKGSLGIHLALGVGALALLVIKTGLWGLGLGEGILLVVVLALAALGGWMSRDPNEEEAA